MNSKLNPANVIADQVGFGNLNSIAVAIVDRMVVAIATDLDFVVVVILFKKFNRSVTSVSFFILLNKGTYVTMVVESKHYFVDSDIVD